MAKQAGLSESLFVNGVDFSGDVGAVGVISSRSAVLDVSAINVAAHERILAHLDGELSYNHFFNDATGAEFLTMRAKNSGSDEVVMYLHGAAIGNMAACLTAKQINFDWERGQDGSLTGPVQCLGSAYGLDYCEQLTAGKRTDTSATNGSSLNAGGATANGLVAYLEVFSVAGTSVTVKIQQSSDDGSGDAFADLITFTTVAAGATAGERKTTAALTTAVEQYLRVVTTGTFSSAIFAVAASRYAYTL